MLKFACCLVALLAICCVSTTSAHHYRGGFKKNCHANKDCKKGLACDVRTEPITFTCLVAFGGLCTRDDDCVNNMSCLSGRCACALRTFYDEEKSDCIKQQTFGQVCGEDKQCASHLICSNHVCLQDIGEKCSDSGDCANSQTCTNGKCGCNTRYQKYNQLSHTCDLYKLDGEHKMCRTNADCYNIDLACDKQTKLCKRTIDVYCNTAADCANGQSCSDNWCSCSGAKIFFDFASKECLAQRNFQEECKQTRECREDLVCDVRVQPTPLSSRRRNACLKSFGAVCKNNTECVNYLPCVDGKCGCRPNYYFSERVNDCLPMQDFGAKCSAKSHCKAELSCDQSPTGQESFSCSYQAGAKCSSNSDCSNNLNCIHGICRCQRHKKYNEEANVCRPRTEEDYFADLYSSEEVDSSSSELHHYGHHGHHGHGHHGHHGHHSLERREDGAKVKAMPRLAVVNETIALVQ